MVNCTLNKDGTGYVPPPTCTGSSNMIDYYDRLHACDNVAHDETGKCSYHGRLAIPLNAPDLSVTHYGTCTRTGPGSDPCGRCCVPTSSATIPQTIFTAPNWDSVWKSTYLGCFKDDATRKLPYQLLSTEDENNMTVEKCAMAAKGHYYFALQDGRQCFAGDKTDLAMMTSLGSSDSCMKQCKGNSSQVCGGSWANQLYSVSTIPTLFNTSSTSISMPSSPMSSYLGCFKDDAASRKLPYQLLSTENNMTIEKCGWAAVSKGYHYFALQNGGQCFAGNDVNLAKSLGSLPNDSCGVPCAGNTRELCGGPSANQLFNISDTPASIPQELQVPYPSSAYLGCFKDDSTRKLPYQLLSTEDGNNMTVEKCAMAANSQGYHYFALQDGRQCFAGNDVNLAKSLGSLPNDSCGVQCKGHKGEKCGGPWANQLYGIDYVKYGDSYATYDGCYRDSAVQSADMTYDAATRVLPTLLGDTSDMTVEKCSQLAFARGLKIFALQNKSQCFGGSDYNRAISRGKLPWDACNSRCTGSLQACGSAWSNQMYIQTDLYVQLVSAGQHVGYLNELDLEGQGVSADAYESAVQKYAFTSEAADTDTSAWADEDVDVTGATAAVDADDHAGLDGALAIASAEHPHPALL